MKVIIMAAGAGTRLNNPGLAKVLHKANGRELLAYVLDSVDNVDSKDVVVVVKHHAEQVMERFPQCNFAMQTGDEYGTAVAVKCGIENGGLTGYKGEILVLNGDTPLVRKSTIEKMLALHREKKAGGTILVVKTEKNYPYGRIIRKPDGSVEKIVEYKDCDDEQKKIDEMNVGMYMFDSELLQQCLPQVKNNNAKGEYYLTDVIGLIIEHGRSVEACITYDDTESLGVNTPEDLAEIEKMIEERKKENV